MQFLCTVLGLDNSIWKIFATFWYKTINIYYAEKLICKICEFVIDTLNIKLIIFEVAQI